MYMLGMKKEITMRGIQQSINFGVGQSSDDYEYSSWSDLGEFQLTDYLITLDVSSIEEFEAEDWG